MFDFTRQIYLNFYTVGSLIPALFFLLTAGFLLGIQNKSKATFHLGMVYLLFSFVPLSYLLNFAWYNPNSAYTRWVSAVISIPASIHFFQFFLYYPENKKSKMASFALYSGWLVTLCFWGFYVYSTSHAQKVYDFSGHYWDFDADNVQGFLAIAIFISLVLVVICALWKIFHSKGKDIWVLTALLISALIVTVVPTVANILSRRALLGRGTFFGYFALLVMVGTFSLIVIYINNTKDKSSFMTKVIGICLVTFFMVLQAVGYLSIRDRDVTFDELKVKDVSLILHQISNPDDLRYIKYYSIDQDYFLSQTNLSEINLDLTEVKIEMINSYYYDSIVKLESLDVIKDSQEKLYFILNSMPIYLEAYKKSILDVLKNSKTTYRTNEILTHLNNLEKILEVKRKEIGKISEENFRKSLPVYLESKNEVQFQPFKASMISYLNRSKSEGLELKKEILWFISIMRPSSSRFYRTDMKSGEHFVSYFYSDLQYNRMYEVGFKYLSYRDYIHKTSLRYTIVILVVVMIVLFGFRLFLYGALIKPLDSLMTGVAKVNKGEYNVRIPVAVSDELGFLGHSFNRMVRSVKSAKLQLQKYAGDLEAKVKDRTSELMHTLEEIQNLKTQQDGDYFLTSLLIKPLGKNNNRSERVHIDFMISQKKKFQFRSYKEEIGGDICISYNITLRNRPMSIFLNADAMGKSMQGAGGALVIGAVFQSIIQRTRYSKEMQKEYPEKWLKNTFVELHKVFETFKGSMLVSILMGLVEDETGFMYYVNAEHPYTILYRDGKADFIEKSSLLRKLGTIDMQSSVFVQTFQMLPGDIIISGSDGKDDVLLGIEEDGRKIINDEETWILAKVEDGKGDLKKIYTSLSKGGELTDDLSLLRVEYDSNVMDLVIDLDMLEVDEMILESKNFQNRNGHARAIEILESAYRKCPKHIQLNKILINIYLHSGNFKRAAKMAERFSENYPMEFDYMYIASYAYKRASLYEKARITGERLKLRLPDLVKNLSNLAEVYFYLKDYEKSLLMIQRTLKKDSENIRALLIKKKLAKMNIK